MPTRRHNLSLRLLVPAALAVVACSVFSPGATDVPTTRPADFSVQYNWFEGSLPPPYHYEYSIHVTPDGTGTVTMIPNYPGDDVPVWTETFTVEPADFDAFYARLVALGAFSTNWDEADEVPVGGSYYFIALMVNGQTTAIPAFVVREQAAAQGEISALIYGLVPPDIWASLNMLRDHYLQENS